ncbi:MAG TPA: hypothetical protein VFQ45_21550 [Longimicrobium sp.]|nr:hypothetical protein [Longimicrobium sp.]
MNSATLRTLPLAALALALAACGGGDEPADTAGDTTAAASAAPAPSGAPAAVSATGGGSCESYGFGGPMEQQLGLQAGSRGTLPADFPEPPAGATLCGARPDLDIAYFTGGGAGQEAILTHYRNALTAQGYTVDANDAGMEQGDTEMSFRKEGAANGSVYADKDGTFSVMYTALR